MKSNTYVYTYIYIYIILMLLIVLRVLRLLPSLALQTSLISTSVTNGVVLQLLLTGDNGTSSNSSNTNSTQ